MAIQHKDIPNSELHEPKGVSSAVLDTVYVANGAGGGSWKKIGSTSLLNSTGDGGVSGLVVRTDGVGGLVLKTEAAFGMMGITNNTTNFPISAAVDATLATTSDYVLLGGTGSVWVSEQLFGVTFGTSRLIAPVTGLYEIKYWANVSAFPSSTAKVAVRYRVNGASFSAKATIDKATAAGDAGTLLFTDYVSLAANDYIQPYVASTATGNLVIQNSSFALELKRAT